jgi:hypothetical protein
MKFDIRWLRIGLLLPLLSGCGGSLDIQGGGNVAAVSAAQPTPTLRAGAAPAAQNQSTSERVLDCLHCAP